MKCPEPLETARKTNYFPPQAGLPKSLSAKGKEQDSGPEKYNSNKAKKKADRNRQKGEGHRDTEKIERQRIRLTT